MLPKLAHTFFPRRLLFQLALPISLAVLLIVVVYAWYAANEQSEYAQNSANIEVQELAQNIVANSTDFIVNKDFAGLENLLVRTADLPSVLELRIADRQGRVLSHVASQSGGEPVIRFGSKTIDVPSSVNASPRIDYIGTDNSWRHALGLGDPGKMVVWQPIFSGTLLGWVVVDYSLATTAEIRRHIWRSSLFGGAIAILASILLPFLFLKRPMDALQSATDFAARLDTLRGEQITVFHNTREIESLGIALNHVSERFPSYYEKR